MAHININSLRNKFEEVTNLLSGKLDIMGISETKLDDSFPTNQFIINDFPDPYRFDRNRFGGGLMVYIKNNIPSKMLNSHLFISVIIR